ncbi:hypothetical protein F52700_4688 [Fusarium sp. NRRL 52700]|nr:hypothetical protein F52700_4688 [Fusarium sp. NRRL 52700]
MDPFNNLPAEVRIKILGSIPSHATTARLIRASPIMLAQYATTESNNLRAYLSQLVGTDFNGHDILQDALAIIYCSRPYQPDEICDLVREWEAKTLPLPFHRGDKGMITKLRLLFERMSEFIDDYLSKATAQNTAEAYLQPPRRTYVDTVDPQRITLHDLNPQERLRLFRVFIKFEVICKLSNERVHEWVRRALNKIRSSLVMGLSSWEKKALMCVYEYMKASYSAMFVHCPGAHAFKDYKRTCNHLRRTKRDNAFFVETMCYDPQYPFIRYKFPKSVAEFPQVLPLCGFDVLSHLMMEAKAERNPMRIARMCSRYDWRSYDSASHIVYRLEVGSRGNLIRLALHRNRADTEANPVERAHRTIHQQRARVFFDDARLCPGQEAHFPTEEEVEREEARLKYERIMETRKEWEEYQAKKRAGKRCNPPDYTSSLKKWDKISHTRSEGIVDDTETYYIVIPPPFFALPEARRRG